jgi:carbonic anhydrase/acetyltransferase-like protein (isoleucine patch superfamily)
MCSVRGDDLSAVSAGISVQIAKLAWKRGQPQTCVDPGLFVAHHTYIHSITVAIY